MLANEVLIVLFSTLRAGIVPTSGGRLHTPQYTTCRGGRTSAAADAVSAIILGVCSLFDGRVIGKHSREVGHSGDGFEFGGAPQAHGRRVIDAFNLAWHWVRDDLCNLHADFANHLTAI